MKKDWLEATQCGDCERVLFLLSEGANIDSLDHHNQTALINAAYRGDTPLVRLLVKHGAKLNHTAKHHLTALMLAVINGHIKIVRILTKAGANTELAGNKGPFDCTPLEYAVKHGHTEIATILHNRSMQAD